MSEVVAHWDRQAREHGMADTATSPDHFYRELEIRCIMPYIRNGVRVLDIGCGNGYATRKFANINMASRFTGMDISEEMILHTPARKPKNLMFVRGDVMRLTGQFDQVISTRCLINLPSWEAQQIALKNILDVLPKGGELILVENTIDGLELLNEQRAKLGLSNIQMKWHNKYFNLRDLRSYLAKGFEVMAERNIGCPYYLISRVLYAKLAADAGEELRYDHPINEIAAQLPVLGNYGYSPNYLWHLRKK